MHTSTNKTHFWESNCCVCVCASFENMMKSDDNFIKLQKLNKIGRTGFSRQTITEVMMNTHTQYFFHSCYFHRPLSCRLHNFFLSIFQTTHNDLQAVKSRSYLSKWSVDMHCDQEFHSDDSMSENKCFTDVFNELMR